MKCQKDKCLGKQVNPDKPGIYFGTPFEYDENWLGCVFCCMEKPKLLKRKKEDIDEANKEDERV
jgi:hypothetical protein